jgi:hypothetical protein
VKDIQGMLKQAQALQAKMNALQEELRTRELVGTSGGGAVKITMNGAHEVTVVSIDPSVVKPEEADLLEDLVLVAHRDARGKISRMVEEEMGRLTGGMGLPPGLF